MSKFHVTKVVTSDNLSSFIEALNQQTRDGYVADQTRVSPKLWLLRIACTYRGDADLVRGL